MAKWNHYCIASLMLCFMLAHATTAARTGSDLRAMVGGTADATLGGSTDIDGNFDAGSHRGSGSLHHEGTIEGGVDTGFVGSGNIEKQWGATVNGVGGFDVVHRGPSNIGHGGTAEGHVDATIGGYGNNERQLGVLIGHGSTAEGHVDSAIGGYGNIERQLGALTGLRGSIRGGVRGGMEGAINTATVGDGDEI